MTRQRAYSYSSSTISSNSSDASNKTYASINSDSSTFSRLSSQQPTLWMQPEKQKSKPTSLVSVIKRLFRHKSKGEPSKLTQKNLELHPASSVSFHTMHSSSSLSSRRKSRQCTLPPPSLPSSNCPAGLYCVIEDFLTEYDLRLIEEEERAKEIARKSKELL